MNNTYKVPTQIAVSNIVELKNVASTLRKIDIQIILFLVTIKFVEDSVCIAHTLSESLNRFNNGGAGLLPSTLLNL
jgi:hypothetical protein